MILRGSQTPINTAQNAISNRLRTERKQNHQKKRRNQANFNEFLGLCPCELVLSRYPIHSAFLAEWMGEHNLAPTGPPRTTPAASPPDPSAPLPRFPYSNCSAAPPLPRDTRTPHLPPPSCGYGPSQRNS